MYKIILYTDSHSYLSISLEKHLTDLGYEIINVDVGTRIDDIAALNVKISAIVIYTDGGFFLSKMQTLVFLRDKALESNIPCFIIGDMNELKKIREVVPNHLIHKEFQRPVNVIDIVNELDEYIINNRGQYKKSVLVVDDSGAMLRSVKSWLEPKYQVILANSGAMAIKYLSTNRPDLVLLDYEMPVINGKQVLEMIRSETEFSDVPVIFLTGKNDKESIEQVISLKPEGYILKSTKPEQIVSMIDEFFLKNTTL